MMARATSPTASGKTQAARSSARKRFLGMHADGFMQSRKGMPSNSGYNWSAVYDALNRRLRTTTVLVTNGVASTAPPQTINSYFDPQVEFLELGVSYGDQTVWKLYGPDLNGKYGGLNGTGGLDGVSPYLNLFYPLISDFRGNILAEITNGMPSWIPARPTGYGAVPGYRPAAFANGADMAQSSAWRGREVDITGYYQIGLRPYDPVSGRWLTYDSVWNERDPNYYSFAGGEPIMGFDPDGRLSQLFYNNPSSGQPSLFGLNNNLGTVVLPDGTVLGGSSSYQMASTALNIGGIAQFGGEFGSGTAAIGNNFTFYSGGFYGNQYVSVTRVSTIAKGVAPFLAVATTYMDYQQEQSGQMSPWQFGANTTATGVGFLGPVGAAFSVGYTGGSLIQGDVNGAVAGSFQILTDWYYSAPFGPNFADMPDNP